MKKDIAIYGAGGLGREVACIIAKLNAIEDTWNIVGFFDDGKERGFKTEYGEVLGGIDTLNQWTGELSVVIAIGTPRIVKSLVEKITNPKVDFPNIIAPDTYFMDAANYKIGKGNFINCSCFISCNVHIGNFNTIGAFTSLGHDSVIGDYNTLMPSAQVCGYVQLGGLDFLGINSIVLQNNTVGRNVTLGCCSVLMADAKDTCTYFGNPARAIISKKEE